MKYLLILLFFVPLFAVSQQPHTVQAKETLYSLARKYNVHPRELAAYNNIPVETALTIGQVIRIPAKTTMAPLPPVAPVKNDHAEKMEVKPQTTAPVNKVPVEKQTESQVVTEQVKKQEPVPVVVQQKKEAVYPVYHKVAKKESLYAISKSNNVSIADIKKWNKLTGEGLNEGMNLIVGYANSKQAEKTPEPIVKEENKTVNVDPPATETKPVVTKPAETEKTLKQDPVNEEIKKVAVKDFSGGVFKSLYDEQQSNKKAAGEVKGQAGIFKSTSGWQDGKYYCLSNSVPAGTIVKINNPATRKNIYAKVLDLIPDLKQNSGIIIRISDAGAKELAAGSDNFECTINY